LSELFTCNILTISYPRMYQKLPNTVIVSCWKCVTRKFGFVFYVSTHLQSLTLINSINGPGGAEVTNPLWMGEVPGSILGSGNGFYVWHFVLLLCFYFFVQKHIFTQFSNSFCNVDLHIFCKLDILQDVWPIITK